MATASKILHLTFSCLAFEGEDALLAILAFSHLKSTSIITILSLILRFDIRHYLGLPFSSFFLLIPLMVHEYMLYVPFVASKIDLRHPKRDASKNVPIPTVSECDTPKPGGPNDYRQPAETCVSHIMRPIHE